MTIRRAEIVAALGGLLIGCSAFVGCGVIKPCGDTKTVDEYPIVSGTYGEGSWVDDGGAAEVPLRHGHGEKTLRIERDEGLLEVRYFDNELREVVEVWQIGDIKQVEGYD